MLAGDTSYREIPGDVNSADLTVSHGGYDNTDVQRDINCMFPIDRLRELAEEGVIGSVASTHFGLMGGGGDIRVFTDVTGPAIAQKLKDAHVDAVLLTAG
jgi:D-proline reductase (dithiol) PrdB